MSSLFKRFSFYFGLVTIAAYWWMVKPEGPFLGYFEDYCTDLVRQIMAENLKLLGKPRFLTDSVMAPAKDYFPFMSWPMERDWVGAFAWNWDKKFPFLWVYFGVSLLASYLGVGHILKKMRLLKGAAWGFATFAILFHVPRHYKIWKHSELLPQHWVYWAFFLDAWIWQRFIRERKWSWSLEIWRAFLMIGTFGIAGYYWGPMILEWMLIRGFMIFIAWKHKNTEAQIQVEGKIFEALLPSLLSLVWIALLCIWVLPLAKEILKLGFLKQSAGWFAHLGFFIRPLWLDVFLDPIIRLFVPASEGMSSIFLNPVDFPETIVSVGWVFLIPAGLGVFALRKKKKGPGVVVVGPFLALLLIAFLYASHAFPTFFILLVQAVVPFMKFFRACSRWGLLLPQLFTVLILLSFPELKAFWKLKTLKWSGNKKRWVLCAFFGLSLVEGTHILKPILGMPRLPESADAMFEKIHALPGTTVLDMPFCVMGGNWMCAEEQCPGFPWSTTGACLRVFHEKKIFGFYASRMAKSHCDLYRKDPYENWFKAWNSNHCFTDRQWDQFCDYLDEHREISALLLYPDMWKAANEPDCAKAIEVRLGLPEAEITLPLDPHREKPADTFHRIRWYQPKCNGGRRSESN